MHVNRMFAAHGHRSNKWNEIIVFIQGLYDLQVRDASTVDEGKYVCQINHKGNTTISQTADVRVLGNFCCTDAFSNYTEIPGFWTFSPTRETLLKLTFLMMRTTALK